jgi:hypothetical protein
MKNKKFRELDISTYVQDQAKTYIEKWLSVNTTDQYIKLVYFVTREIHTIIRNAQPFLTDKKVAFTGKPAEPVPRYDKIILAAT